MDLPRCNSTASSDSNEGGLYSRSNSLVAKTEIEREKINSRERQRMHQLNRALDELRSVLPQTPGVCKLSKMSTLQAARNYILSLASSIAELQQLLLYYQVLTRLPTVNSGSTGSSLLSSPSSTNSRLDLLHSSASSAVGVTGSSADDKLSTSIAMSALTSPTTADMYRELTDPTKLSNFLMHQSEAASAMSRMCKDSSGAAGLFSRGLPPALPRHYHPLSSPAKMPSATSSSFPFPGALSGLRMNSMGSGVVPSTLQSPEETSKTLNLSP